MSAVYALPIESPWRLSDLDERRFDRLVLAMIIIFTLCGIIVPFLPVPEIERSKVEALPPRFAKLLIENKKTPPPPPPKIEQELPKDKPKEKKPEPKNDIAEARKKASRSGILALQNELADLREHTALKKVKTTNKQVTDGTKATVKRSIIASHANKGSGGIDTSRLSRNVVSTNLAGRETTQVESPVSLGKVTTGMSGGDRLAARTIEEIQLIFDKNKGAIYSIYNRALRKNPTLRGKVVLSIKIDPSGKVLDCKIISSEVDSAEFAEKLVTRVKLFNFGAKDVDTMVITYPIDFLPS